MRTPQAWRRESDKKSDLKKLTKRTGKSCVAVCQCRLHVLNSRLTRLSLDFAKAFDKVPHQRFLLKVAIGGKLFDWISNWLLNRTLGVCINDTVSVWKLNKRNTTRVGLGTITVLSRDAMHPRYLGLPDLPYFTGDPVFQTPSPASGKEATGKNKSPVFC